MTKDNFVVPIIIVVLMGVVFAVGCIGEQTLPPDPHVFSQCCSDWDVICSNQPCGECCINEQKQFCQLTDVEKSKQKQLFLDNGFINDFLTIGSLDKLDIYPSENCYISSNGEIKIFGNLSNYTYFFDVAFKDNNTTFNNIHNATKIKEYILLAESNDKVKEFYKNYGINKSRVRGQNLIGTSADNYINLPRISFESPLGYSIDVFIDTNNNVRVSGLGIPLNSTLFPQLEKIKEDVLVKRFLEHENVSSVGIGKKYLSWNKEDYNWTVRLESTNDCGRWMEIKIKDNGEVVNSTKIIQPLHVPDKCFIDCFDVDIKCPAARGDE